MMKNFVTTSLCLGATLLLVGCGSQYPHLEPNTPSSEFTSESRKTLIPETCQSFFDGCNNCTRMADWEAACTRMACEQYEAPRCTDDEALEELVGIANPASEYCLTQGGESQIKKNADGSEYGVCVIDGEEIDEWEYFRQSTSQFVGRPFAEVQKEFEDSGASVRIAVEDWEPKALTADYRPDRLNVEVMSGVIVNAYFG